MHKNVTILLAVLAAMTMCMAQPADTSRFNVHMSVGGAVLSGFGNSQALTWAAPWVSYKATDRLTLHGGFAAAGTLLPNNFQLQGRGERSYAPRREGTRAGLLWAVGEYQASDNLRVWAAVAVARGWIQPLWAGESLPLAAAAVDGGFAYRFSEGSVLAMHFRFVSDHYGTLLYPPYGHNYYGPLAPEWELFGGQWPYWNIN